MAFCFGGALCGSPGVWAPKQTQSATAAVEGRAGGSRLRRRSGVVAAMAPVDAMLARVGTAPCDWDNLGFQYSPTNGHVRYTWKNGKWDSGVFETDPYLRIHLGATALHYGQTCFEGLKAFAGPDGRVRIFRPDENAKRMATSAQRLVMPNVPAEMFIDAAKWAVRENLEFVPPYGTGSSMYLRPLLFGSGPKIGLSPSEEYTFLVTVVPVGDYYKGGLSPVTAVVSHQYDRAAARGVGNVKVGANYAADLLPQRNSIEQGYPINLYLDPMHGKYIEEFGTSNFIAINGDKFITPDSSSVLKSITNKSLMVLAEKAGMEVERRKIDIDEVANFEEAAACGTAVIITPITRIVLRDRIITVGSNPDQVPPRFNTLYNQVRAIQFGEEKDDEGWAFDILD